MQNHVLFGIISFMLISCHSDVPDGPVQAEIEIIESIEIPSTLIDKSKLNYDPKTSIWSLNNERFTGYAISYYDDNMMKQKFGVFDGRKQNEALDWYKDGHLKYSSFYHQGKLQGEKKAWSSDTTHILISQLNYHKGKLHGIQKKWYSTGEIFKILNLNMGKEEGIQKAFRKNGALFANYESREGRIFGLKRASLCFGLEDEVIQFKK